MDPVDALIWAAVSILFSLVIDLNIGIFKED